MQVINGQNALMQGTGSLYFAYEPGVYFESNPLEMKIYYGALNIYGGDKIDWDADALAFVQTASVSDPNQMVGINNLVKALKSGSNPWGDIDFIYPFAGQDYSLNIVNPGGSSLTFGSAMTSGSTGIIGDGTSNSYADTLINARGRNISYGLFVVDDVSENKIDFGAQNDSLGPSDIFEMYLKTQVSGVARASINKGTTDYIQGAVTSSRGFTVVTAQPDDLRIYKEGNFLVSGSQTGSRLLPLDGAKWAIGAYAVGSNSWTDNASKTYGFAFYTANTLTSTQVSELNDAVQDYITLLGR